MPSQTREQLAAELQALIVGFKKNLASSPLTISGKSYSAAQSVAFLQSCLDAVNTVADAEGKLADARKAEKAYWATNTRTLKAFRALVALMFADNVNTLADFGMEPKKPRKVMSAETLLLRAAKSRATRAKRRTMGKRQKAAIKGDVTGVDIKPVTGG